MVMPRQEPGDIYPSTDNRKHRQNDQRSQHDPGRLMHAAVPMAMVIMSIVPRSVCCRWCGRKVCISQVGIRFVFAKERHEPEPEHVEGGKPRGDHSEGPQPDVAGVRALIDSGKDLVFAEEG